MSLLDSRAAFNCEVIRDCYEAFALYCFERYLIACLGIAAETFYLYPCNCLELFFKFMLVKVIYTFSCLGYVVLSLPIVFQASLSCPFSFQ